MILATIKNDINVDTSSTKCLSKKYVLGKKNDIIFKK